ncbi:invasion associated locus B family protein [Aurantimonas sp. 22II-16-19i]|uniref:invasion associated locus B family protein n=1 Tax=Aurantimonas sp. 22II-16-19i TaxID=1317114 RepID=UPI00159460D0|nr:invasion associated locus B family protein [Aurantimonas sp. 22II-16-19i]
MTVVLTLFPAPLALAQGDKAGKTVTLPGGASSIVESYQDWSVNCRVTGNAKLCRFSQKLANQENGQSLLTIEFQPVEAGVLSGAIALPFGLRLAEGIRLSVDGKEAQQTFTFSTCLAIGCLVPIRLGAAEVATLQAGMKLEILAIAHDSGQRLSFPVSLLGFSTAASRTATLAEP